MCGFVGAPTTGFNVTAWSPRHLGLLLRMHQMYGVDWSPPGFHSGYNEEIIASALLNARLPGIVEAFFAVAGADPNADATGVNVVDAHRDFLERFHLDEAQVPLLKLTPSSWEAPFSRLAKVRVRTAQPKRGSVRRAGFG